MDRNKHFYFYKAVDYILDKKIVKTKTELAQIFRISPSKLSEILKQRMNPGIDLYKILVKEFNINPFWLLTGEGEMLLSGGHIGGKSSGEIEAQLREHIRDLQKTIDILTGQIQTLKDQLAICQKEKQDLFTLLNQNAGKNA